MKKKGTAKTKKELEGRFGAFAANMPGYHDHIDFRLLDDFNDEAFAYLMENVKGVNMLDVNETDISNESITLLTSLEYVNELRAKQCRNLSNDCTEDLNKLTSLVFLHLKNTNISIDGLLKLNNLTNLKTLMFSADDIVPIKQKLLELKTMLPLCELVINSKSYYVNAIDIFIYALKQFPFSYRLKIKKETLPNAWSRWLSQPADNFVEAAAQGIYPVDDIEWVEINTTEKSNKEESNSTAAMDHFSVITKLLDVLEFPYIMEDGVISVYLLNKEV